jgi:hypothetical protein
MPSHPDDGITSESNRVMEDHFHNGICYEVSKLLPLIKRCMMISVILSFATNDDGWEAIKRGSLLRKRDASSTRRHAVLIELYDLGQDVAICLNSRSARTERRFNVKLAALQEFRTTKVFFTVDSIREKKVQISRPVCEESLGRLNG